MPLTDYFVASDDADAARVTSGSGGPATLGFPTLQTKGVDPAVTLGTLESILTDRSYEDVITGSRQGQPITDTEADAIVVTVTDMLRDVLAATTPQDLEQVAQRWATTDELKDVSTGDLAQFLGQFAALARDAVARDHHLYCWWAL